VLSVGDQRKCTIRGGANKSLARPGRKQAGWTDNLLGFFFFLSGLQNLEQRAKKCVVLRWEYVEQYRVCSL